MLFDLCGYDDIIERKKSKKSILIMYETTKVYNKWEWDMQEVEIGRHQKRSRVNHISSRNYVFKVVQEKQQINTVYLTINLLKMRLKIIIVGMFLF